MKVRTISEAIQYELNHGSTPLTQKETGGEHTIQSRIIFKRDIQKERDLAIRDELLLEIMENRNVNREEAIRILDNPF